MVNVILHIGMHKTGSSAIQQALNGFASEDFAYLSLGHANHSIPLYTAFSQHYKNYHIWKRSGVSESHIEQMRHGFRAMLQRQISDASAPNLIISGEGISHLSEDEVIELAQLMTDAGASVQVVAYFRNPISYVSSSLQEVIKSGARVEKTIELPRYRFRFEKFLRIFGRQAMDLRDFDKVRRANIDVLEDFSESIGLKAQKRVAKPVNTALSGTAVRALALLDNANVLTLGDALVLKARERLIDRLRPMFDDKFQLPRDIVLDALDGRDVAWLEEITGISFDIVSLDRSTGPNGGYQRRLNDFLSDFPQEACAKVAAELERDGVPTESFEDPVALLTRLYYQELRSVSI